MLVPAALATLVALIVLWPGRERTAPGGGCGERALGTVTAVAELACPPGRRGRRRCGTATVRVTEGPGAGSGQTVDLPQGPGAPRAARRATTWCCCTTRTRCPGGRRTRWWTSSGRTPLIWLVALAAAVILVFGRWRGLTSLAGLAVSFARAAAVRDARRSWTARRRCWWRWSARSAIMFAALYLTHGVNVHTSVAVAGHAGQPGAHRAARRRVHRAAAADRGRHRRERRTCPSSQGDVDLRGLLLAGIVIGALGVLDDVTVTQAVTVAEMAAGRRRQPAGSCTGRRSGSAGRTSASAVNTIVLAYAGASLPLLLLIAAGSQPVGELLTSEFLAQEILRSAVGHDRPGGLGPDHHRPGRAGRRPAPGWTGPAGPGPRSGRHARALSRSAVSRGRAGGRRQLARPRDRAVSSCAVPGTG